jgi:mannose-6-phosphate isomerase-like protein (cupin superfamily)
MLIVFMKKVVRPWGEFKQFVLNEKCTVKVHSVKPFGVLSLQKHKRRREMWYFLTDGWVQMGKGERKVKRGEVVNVGKGQVHRFFSKGSKVEVLEIAFGTFDEKDEVRLEDKYGRV